MVVPEPHDTVLDWRCRHAPQKLCPEQLGLHDIIATEERPVRKKVLAELIQVHISEFGRHGQAGDAQTDLGLPLHAADVGVLRVEPFPISYAHKLGIRLH